MCGFEEDSVEREREQHEEPQGAPRLDGEAEKGNQQRRDLEKAEESQACRGEKIRDIKRFSRKD